jgi:hypothetical protein
MIHYIIKKKKLKMKKGKKYSFFTKTYKNDKYIVKISFHEIRKKY